MKQYCYKIRVPGEVPPASRARLKRYIAGLYVGDPPRFPPGELPFYLIYVDGRDREVCLRLTTRSAKNAARIEQINASLPSRALKWKGVRLDPPRAVRGDETYAWWEEAGANRGRPASKKTMWTSIVQQGPYFAHLATPYRPLGAALTYGGKRYRLTPREERAARLYAQRLISEARGGTTERQTRSAVFNRHFWKDFQGYLTAEHRKAIKTFKGIGWEDVVAKLRAQTEAPPTPTARQAARIAKAEAKEKHGYAYLNGRREELSNYAVEPMGIFMGRGRHPLRGRIKPSINPGDVTLNLGRADPIPPAPAGHRWGGVVHNRRAQWLASWTDTITGKTKYVRFAQTGRFKGAADLAKYEKARKLQKRINGIRRKYMADAEADSIVKRQLGTVLWLIDHYGVRPGDARGANEADTVGASTLRVSHVTPVKGKIRINFLGKDSVRFNKTLDTPPPIYDNFVDFIRGRPKDAQVFGLISAARINRYLKKFNSKFSNKVFRTRIASCLMYEGLARVRIRPGATKQEIRLAFDRATRRVAVALTHTRGATAKANESLRALVDAKRADMEALARASGKEKARLERRVAAATKKIQARRAGMNVAMSTSLANYIDPRLVVAWARKNGGDRVLDAVYPAALRRKFRWADSTPADWDWMTSPLAK